MLLVGFVGYALWKRRWAWIVAGGLAVAITDPLCARVLKPAFGRERPCRALLDVRTPEGCGAASAMPSVHAANTAALAAAVGSPVLASVAVVTGLSRVVAGQHWPSDVLVGWGVGGAVGAGIGAATRAVMRRRRQSRGRETGPIDATRDRSEEERPWT